MPSVTPLMSCWRKYAIRNSVASQKTGETRFLQISRTHVFALLRNSFSRHAHSAEQAREIGRLEMRVEAARIRQHPQHAAFEVLVLAAHSCFRRGERDAVG